jgi:DNA-binding transcriptional LysR family regulator
VTQDEAAIAGAVAGPGVAASSMPREEIENGSLVHVLPDWDLGSMEINALFVSGKSIKPAAWAFVDFLIREGSARPGKER